MPAARLLTALIVCSVPLMAAAQPTCAVDVSFTFTESAPRDLFELQNNSSTGQTVQRLSLALAGSAGRLIFDTAPGAPGVNVFQPLRVEGGDARLVSVPSVPDGSESLELVFERFEPGQRFRFSIDVDDRLSASDMGPTRVSGRELEGATLTAMVGPAGGPGREVQAQVSGANQARLQAACG